MLNLFSTSPLPTMRNPPTKKRQLAGSLRKRIPASTLLISCRPVERSSRDIVPISDILAAAGAEAFPTVNFSAPNRFIPSPRIRCSSLVQVHGLLVFHSSWCAAGALIPPMISSRRVLFCTNCFMVTLMVALQHMQCLHDGR